MRARARLLAAKRKAALKQRKAAESRWSDPAVGIALLMGFAPPMKSATMTRRGVESKGRTVKVVGLFANDYGVSGY
jgi:hypothetical protein